MKCLFLTYAVIMFWTSGLKPLGSMHSRINVNNKDWFFRVTTALGQIRCSEQTRPRVET